MVQAVDVAGKLEDYDNIGEWSDAIHHAAIRVASDNGHSMVDDPPAALTKARRWTCSECGATAIDFEGNIYGSAIDNTCDEYKSGRGER